LQHHKKQIPQRKKQLVSTLDPITTSLQLVMAMGTNSVEVPWDAIGFLRNSDIQLYMHMSYVLEVAATIKSLMYWSFNC